jgi:hypothetical protein
MHSPPSYYPFDHCGILVTTGEPPWTCSQPKFRVYTGIWFKCAKLPHLPIHCILKVKPRATGLWGHRLSQALPQRFGKPPAQVCVKADRWVCKGLVIHKQSRVSHNLYLCCKFDLNPSCIFDLKFSNSHFILSHISKYDDFNYNQYKNY